jgi:ATP-binding cassette subfamily F protein uup
VTVTLGLDGSGKVDIVAGGFEDWKAKRATRAAPAKKAEKAEPTTALRPAPAKSTKLSYKDQRDYDLLPKRIEELDAVIAKAEMTLGDASLFTRDPDKFHRTMKGLETARAEKLAAEGRWLALAEMVEG